MSGVEAAGIALAVFPLCIELVKLYRNGAETLDYMRRRHHQKALRNFHRELGIEYSKFLNSLYEIFGDEITEEACIRVFRNPAGNEAQERLEARLDYSPHVAKSFTEAIEYLREELEDLKSIFPWDQGIGDMTVVEHIQCVQAGSQIPQVKPQSIFITKYLLKYSGTKYYSKFANQFCQSS